MTLTLIAMDPLIFTASLFIIPLNMAAARGQYFLMNQLLFVTLTSWAHHAICHSHKYKEDVYHKVDKIAVYTSIIHTAILAIAYDSWLYWFFLSGIGISYEFVKRNKHYEMRGLHNWHYQIPHIAMHLSTFAGLICVVNRIPYPASCI